MHHHQTSKILAIFGTQNVKNNREHQKREIQLGSSCGKRKYGNSLTLLLVNAVDFEILTLPVVAHLIAIITIIIDSMTSVLNTDASLPYNHDLFESLIVKKKNKVPQLPVEVQVNKTVEARQISVSWKYTSHCTATKFTVAVYDNIGENVIADVGTELHQVTLSSIPTCVPLVIVVRGYNEFGLGKEARKNYTLLIVAYKLHLLLTTVLRSEYVDTQVFRSSAKDVDSLRYSKPQTCRISRNHSDCLSCIQGTSLCRYWQPVGGMINGVKQLIRIEYAPSVKVQICPTRRLNYSPGETKNKSRIGKRCSGMDPALLSPVIWFTGCIPDVNAQVDSPSAPEIHLDDHHGLDLISLFKRRKADLREDVLLTCLISSIHRYTGIGESPLHSIVDRRLFHCSSNLRTNRSRLATWCSPTAYRLRTQIEYINTGSRRREPIANCSFFLEHVDSVCVLVRSHLSIGFQGSCKMRTNFSTTERLPHPICFLDSLPIATQSDVGSYWDEIAICFCSAQSFVCGRALPGALWHWITDRTVILLNSRRNIPAGSEHNLA
ncbi:endonuclease-reverse transcriptase [Clonorchis sinensis]|uniref:Endonuclease-reverse transcriptase n=1 Tax=Clonorchis sinensis TaxID=79923 RepID=G7YJ70_CLOSI|nr:endonuclease-reverse transcriptase [Clonorchis sinensis]